MQVRIDWDNMLVDFQVSQYINKQNVLFYVKSTQDILQCYFVMLRLIIEIKYTDIYDHSYNSTEVITRALSKYPTKSRRIVFKCTWLQTFI